MCRRKLLHIHLDLVKRVLYGFFKDNVIYLSQTKRVYMFSTSAQRSLLFFPETHAHSLGNRKAIWEWGLVKIRRARIEIVIDNFFRPLHEAYSYLSINSLAVTIYVQTPATTFRGHRGRQIGWHDSKVFM